MRSKSQDLPLEMVSSWLFFLCSDFGRLKDIEYAATCKSRNEDALKKVSTAYFFNKKWKPGVKIYVAVFRDDYHQQVLRHGW